eukprot:GHUV01029843.1.p2 GENE.GHUV01029843.1~~GHUV01029843.1.p2  ORF type:complete len:101 (+),score=9.14 GHUV01029843.1:529-831(+)
MHLTLYHVFYDWLVAHCAASTDMSCVGAVRFGGHRIAGLSGTYVSQHYHWGHHEKLPYDERTVKSAYHVRQLHVHRLMQVGAIDTVPSTRWLSASDVSFS